MQQFSRKFTVEAPSNIAFVKYWGKHGRQLPMNPSISMTLKNCVTKMEIDVSLDGKIPGVIEYHFEGKDNPKFMDKINKYLNDIEDIYPLSRKLSFKIKSENTFPHSAGIASSASAMGALGYALAYIEKCINPDTKFAINERASGLARLGSGSACRSILPSYSFWGYHPHLEMGDDELAKPLTEIHENFSQVCDTVLIVDKGEKSVSSTAGHKLMDGHSFKEGRKQQALENFRITKNALESGDWESFGEVLELEALTLHGLMMSSEPSYILLVPNSLEIILKVRAWREQNKLPLYFTIDAGPNIHLIYPKNIEEEVRVFIETELKNTTEEVIYDEIGNGPKIIEHN